MVKINLYTFTYIRYGKEENVDMIAVDPEIAVQNFVRWTNSRYGVEHDIVEIRLLSEHAVYYKTDKRKQ